MWLLSFLVEIRNISILQTGSRINPHQSSMLLWKDIFNVKYIENGKRYDVGLKGGQIENHRPIGFRLAPRLLTLNDLEPS